jgi:exopolysaccharide biosynthesis predicted pyruvyltransferase EpsI
MSAIVASREEWIRIFAAAGNGRVAYYPNPGNAGDALIAVATYQLLRAAGLRYRVVGSGSRATPDTLIAGGGGNLVPPYADVARLLRGAGTRAARVLILPHTIAGNDDLVTAMDARYEVYCRELTSYDYVRTHCRGAQVRLAHDLALCLDVEAAAQFPWRLAWQLARTEALPTAALILHLLQDRAGQRQRGPPPTFYREDREALGGPRPPDRANRDLSQIYAWTVAPEFCARVSTWLLLRALRAAAAVETDRLHITVAAALLGKPVRMHANSYYKNRAVYELSLRDRFPHVQWCDA